jgi:Domain of unknown function (DUF4168)
MRRSVALFFVSLMALLLPRLGLNEFLKPAVAQEKSSKPPSAIDKTQLRSFAKVYVKLEKIRQNYEPRLAQAQNDQESQAVRQEAKSHIDDALTQEGMTADSYREIIKTVNSNDELRVAALELIEEERKKS